MNLMLHGVENPDIHFQDTLSNSFPEKFPNQASGGFDVILANPPFKGSLDESDVHSSLTSVVKTKKTELLFLILILRMLKKGGRSATIVPDGVLFGSSKAHTELRRVLIEKNQLEAVISLPPGVFKPYAGVSTAIIVFRNGGTTEDVFFYTVGGDGLSLDDKRTDNGPERGVFGPTKDNDLYDALARWRKKDAKKDLDRTAKHFTVPLSEIEAKEFDLSINRYKLEKVNEVSFDPPKAIIGKLQTLEKEITKDLGELEALL
jgi:type I restriction enzyme M protein